jgi:hypothetical protein
LEKANNTINIIAWQRLVKPIFVKGEFNNEVNLMNYGRRRFVSRLIHYLTIKRWCMKEATKQEYPN